MVRTVCSLPGTGVFCSEIISPNFAVKVSLSHPIVIRFNLDGEPE
jgi:hypothetical protein